MHHLLGSVEVLEFCDGFFMYSPSYSSHDAYSWMYFSMSCCFKALTQNITQLSNGRQSARAKLSNVMLRIVPSGFCMVILCLVYAELFCYFIGDSWS